MTKKKRYVEEQKLHGRDWDEHLLPSSILRAINHFDNVKISYRIGFTEANKKYYLFHIKSVYCRIFIANFKSWLESFTFYSKI